MRKKMMVTEKQVQDALKNALKKNKESNKASNKFDELAGKYFGIDDFSSIYEYYDEIVDPLTYGHGNLTWSQLCKTVKKYKQELKEGND